MGKAFVRNPTWKAEVQKSSEMRNARRASAEAAAAETRRIAPVDTGGYRSGIHVVEADGAARVVAGDEGSVYIEFGTEDTPTFAPLRRGAEAVGLRPGP